MSFPSRKILYLVLWTMILATVYANAQDPFVKFSVIPPSPQAGALARFVDVPVSYFTGTPNISIPLYQVTGREVSVPISLDYNAGGVRVQDVATYVGLGWSLNAGGTITRSVRGKRDDGSYENYALPLIGDGVLDIDRTDNFDEYIASSNLAEGHNDSEPDHYTFNFCGYSGKFFMVNNQAYLMPQKDIKVEKTSGSFSSPRWKVTTADGAQYFFEEPEMTFTHVNGELQTMENSWHLTKIISGNYLDTISFSYAGYGLKYPATVMQTRKYDNYAAGSLAALWDNFVSTSVEIKSKILDTIRYKDITVSFLPGDERQDVMETPFYATGIEKELGGLEVTNGDATLIRKVSLQHSYFGNASGIYHEKRLRLDKVIIDDKEPYSFTYTGNVPSLTSKGMDHWGFYNGTNPTTILPATEGLPGANRETSPTAALCGMIDRVTYPTGGYTDYDFETHRSSWPEVVYSTVGKVNLYAEAGASGQTVQSPEFELEETIGNGDAGIRMEVDLYIPEGAPVSGLANITLELYKSGEEPPVKTFKGTVNGAFNIYVSPGMYYVKIKATAIDSYGSVYISQRTVSGTQVVYRPIGGARVKKTTSFDPISGKSVVRTFRYEVDETSGISSAVLFDAPVYTYYRGEYLPAPPSGWGGVPVECQYEYRAYLYHTSANNAPQGGGPHVGYSKVYVYDGETSANGKSVYEFSTADAGTRFYGPIFGLGRDAGWQLGLLHKETNYNAAGQRLRSKEYHYTYSVPADISFHAVKVQFNDLHPCAGEFSPGPGGIYKRNFNFAWYQCLSQWQYLEKETVTEFVNDQESYREEIAHGYANVLHKQRTQSTVTNNLGEQEVTLLKYPHDYPASATMQQMAGRHLLNKVVEQKKLTNGKITAASLYGYSLLHNQYWMPSKVYNLEAALPVSDFTVADPVAPPAPYVLRQTAGYNTAGDLSTHTDGAGLQRAYLWSRWAPTCEITGTPSDRIAYSSFERGETGNWTFVNSFSSVAKTGRRSYASSTSLSSQSLPAGTYEVTAYVRKADPSGANGSVSTNGTTYSVQTGGWTELRWKITLASSGVVTVTPSTNILLDELRLYPAGALMKTYTMEHGIGVTSTTDTNNRSAHYEYETGRLSLIRDNERNILNQYQYHYKGN